MMPRVRCVFHGEPIARGLGLSRRRTWRPQAGICLDAAIVASMAFASPAWGSFGIEKFENKLLANPEGSVTATQAGSHPYAMTTTIVFNHKDANQSQKEATLMVVPEGDPKNVVVNLPAGVVVNPAATATRCSEAELESTGKCPSSSEVGETTYHIGILGALEATTPVYNMETSPGAPAALGFKAILAGINVHILGRLRTGGDYGLSAEAPNINQQVAFWADRLTVWGYPPGASRPFLTMPTSCGSPLTTTITANSWQEPEGALAEASATNDDARGDAVLVTGCDKLSFNPRLNVQPATHATSSPTGLTVELSIPQEEKEESMSGLAEANLKETVVTLPAGMAASPAAANGGLGACTPEEIGLADTTKPSCPESSKIGTIQIETPLLEQPLEGSVYLAQQGINPFPQEGSNPFKSLIALYIVAEGKGVVVKLTGEVRLDPFTGQLTTRFGENPAIEAENPAVKGHLLVPQLPFSRLKLHFFDGPRAALVSPATCGTYTVTSSLTPYSAPESGPPATPTASFQINQNCHGPRFSPTAVGGTESNRAGAFSPFTFTVMRDDSDENIDRIQVKTPPGLLGMVSSVPLCEEPQAADGTCDQVSRIGRVTAGVGAGPDPLYVTGDVFLTGPYKGAPFGLSIVVPAVAGPFNLGMVKVRATVNIDPHTSVLTVTSEPLPQILEGVPIRLRTVHVSIDRNNFMLNPTSCREMSIGATLTSTLGASAVLSSRFQAADCAALGFHPKFQVITSGHTSRTLGASLDTKLTYPTGIQSNIAQVKVELPKQLPARLKTLQKACTAAVFEANPASCPAASVVGIVKATTPILPVTLTGPAYFVSHGGEAFPDLELVLQGEGVRVDVVGSTFISKANITSSTFKSVPDVPVSSFELYLPQGPNSALAANGNLCKRSPKMPTTFIAQNGAEIHQSTAVAVSGCPKAKAKKAKRASRAGRPHSGRRSK
jgi:hypothetical protein